MLCSLKNSFIRSSVKSGAAAIPIKPKIFSGWLIAVRSIEFVDGIQFFSNGTWDDYQYWEEAGYTFFEDKTIIRNISEYENNADLPEDPEASIVQINDLEYQVNISTTDQDGSIWTVVALTP